MNKKPPLDVTDIINKRFGKLTVIKYLSADKIKHPWKYYYECLCDCGTIKTFKRANIVTHHHQSCGCLRRLKGKESKCWVGCGDLSGRLFTHIKHHAKSRNIEVAITIEDAWHQYLKQNKKCALTGVNLIIDSFKGSTADRTASLDRINSEIGYTKDNIQWIHKDINYIKMDWNQDYFIKLCKMVSDYNK